MPPFKNKNENDEDEDEGFEPLTEEELSRLDYDEDLAPETEPEAEGDPLPDEVAELFDALEKGGSRLGEETRQMVFRTKPAARNVDKIVQVLVRVLVGKRNISERDLDVVLEITKSRIVEAIKAQALVVYLVDPKGIAVRHVSFGRTITERSPQSAKRYAEITRKLVGFIVPRESAVGRVIREGKPKTTLDAAQEPPPDVRKLQQIAEFTVHSMAIVPVAHEGETYGAIQALNKDTESGETFFSQKDVEIMREVADYSARVLYAARNPTHQWSGDDVARYVARVARVEFVDLGDGDVDRATMETIGEKAARQFRILPLARIGGGKIKAAIDDPLDVNRRDGFTTATKLELGEVVVGSRDTIDALIENFWGQGGGTVHIAARRGPGLPVQTPGSLLAAGAGGGDVVGDKTVKAGPPKPGSPSGYAGRGGENLASLGEAFMDVLEQKKTEAAGKDQRDRGKLAGLDISGDSANQAPVIMLVNKLIEDAYARGASDIHIDPFEHELVVRYRVDGLLEDKMKMPSAAARAITSRIKVMATLNISETRLPQDGRIRFKEFTRMPGLDFDLRVATSPMAWGEKIVFRILDRKVTSLGLDAMGFTPYNIERYRACLAAPHGMILHTGPTGSGKTTTLYAALTELNKPDMNILTAEDPIEYLIPGINQLQTKPQIGLTFARALKAYLRQDPDIILVGEIRDLETAEVAVEAALTGHQLFSTLHTNDAAGTVVRFVEMGIEPFLISSALLCVCSQRLMRKLCSCKIAYEPSDDERELLMTSAPPDTRPLCFAPHPKGCTKCQGTGYKGRMGVHELLVMDGALRELAAHKGASAQDLDRLGRQHGMWSLFEDAMAKVRGGISSLEEALRTVKVEKE